MKKLAIIGASYLQLPLIEKAKDLGLETHVFAWAANDVGEEAADYFYPISIIEKEEILEKCQEIGIDGVCSIASDLAVVTVNYVAEKMNLTGNSLESVKRSTDKYVMRQAFWERNDPSPDFRLVSSEDNLDVEEMSFPLIVKPADRSGSRGITKIYDRGEMEEAVETAKEQSFAGNVLIEEYVEGKEYSVECLSFQGRHHFLTLTEKWTTGEPFFIETAHAEPILLDEKMMQRIKDVVFHALDSLLVKNGASHSEIKIDDEGEITIIEIGARMGGDCIGSDLVPLSTGIDYVGAVIQVSLGEEPDLRCKTESVSAKCQFILTDDDEREYKRIKNEEPQRLIRTPFFNAECVGKKVLDSSMRAGCYILIEK